MRWWITHTHTCTHHTHTTSTPTMRPTQAQTHTHHSALNPHTQHACTRAHTPNAQTSHTHTARMHTTRTCAGTTWLSRSGVVGSRVFSLPVTDTVGGARRKKAKKRIDNGRIRTCAGDPNRFRVYRLNRSATLSCLNQF